MSDIRNRRLAADRDRLTALAQANRGRLTIVTTSGTPPESYTIECQCRSVVALHRGRARYGDTHRLAIQLPPEYPLGSPPRATVLTPIRHPHVFVGSQAVCIGYRRQVSEFLDAFVIRLYNILRYDPDYMDPGSPADSEAMKWALNNEDLFPLDPCALVLPGQPAARPAIVWHDRS